MEVTLKIKDNLYEENQLPQKEGEQPKIKRRLIKKNIISKITIDTNDIILTADLLSNKGAILKNYCKVHIKEIGPIIVNHSREEINKLKEPHARFTRIGFKQKNN